MRSCSEEGQASVEAVFVFPLLCAVFALFLQPAFLLFDQIVMTSAASELCRVLETHAATDAQVQAYAQRRLAAVPQVSAFHVGGAQGWTLACEGGELDGEVQVTLSHEVKPLPLLGIGAVAIANMQQNGNVRQEVTAKASLAPGWAASSQGGPADWIGGWQ